MENTTRFTKGESCERGRNLHFSSRPQPLLSLTLSPHSHPASLLSPQEPYLGLVQLQNLLAVPIYPGHGARGAVRGTASISQYRYEVKHTNTKNPPCRTRRSRSTTTHPPGCSFFHLRFSLGLAFACVSSSYLIITPSLPPSASFSSPFF